MRGEHFKGFSKANFTMGSSPHARGAPHVNGQIWRHVGIIPACAGSTFTSTIPAFLRWDHPRMRGEHLSVSVTVPARTGSSPHARGARTTSDRENRGQGIIPACAGSTMQSLRSLPKVRDHPRMRGEHLPKSSAVLKREGSSPHARGAPIMRENLEVVKGIIPACAGSTRRGNQ